MVDRVGNDSFAPGHGVLISKSREQRTPRVWLIDPNPEDIGMIDFYRPDGTPVPVVRGDPRQLNDATFHAGTRSGSEYEYRDTFNRLHFYVLAKHRDAGGVLSYDVGVRRFDGAGPFTRGVALGGPTKTARRPGFLATVHVPVDEHGSGGNRRVRLGHLPPRRELEQPRLEGDAAERARRGEGRPDGPGARARAADPLTDDGDARTVVTLTATSETDSTKTADAHVQRARPRHDAGG